MIDRNELALAQSYEQLQTHPAFKNLLSWLAEDLDSAERAAESATDGDPTAIWVKLIAWQQRKQVMSAIHGKLNEAIEYAEQARQEVENDRRIELDRASRANWS